VGDPEQKIEGRISQVSLMMDSAKQAFPVSAFFDKLLSQQKHRNLVSGMGVDVAVETYHNDKALVLHRNEMVKTAEGYTAFVARGGSAKQVAVEPDEENGLRYEIAAGLNEGDLLIFEGQHRLDNDARLNAVTVAAGTARR
jgi:multidrug efflux pump subunit AcrA (membrane-fusion protein)